MLYEKTKRDFNFTAKTFFSMFVTVLECFVEYWELSLLKYFNR